jgi:hypothetical protein
LKVANLQLSVDALKQAQEEKLTCAAVGQKFRLQQVTLFLKHRLQGVKEAELYRSRLAHPPLAAAAAYLYAAAVLRRALAAM